jgi:hypothetical protein
MLALLAYPILIEPRVHLRDSGWLSQTGLWTLGYLLLAALVLACALILWRIVPLHLVSTSDAGAPSGESTPTSATGMTEAAPTPGRRLRWVALAFVPSSLLLGATTYITTDIAAVPLLWVLPLAIYLLSFILAFGRWPAPFHGAVVTAVLPVVLLAIFLMVSGFPQRIWVTVFWHLLVLLVVALACHGELALDRPSPRHLTEFYLLISVGGVLGGLFNALVAPLVFNTLVEYPLVMVLACVLLVSPPAAPGRSGRALAVDVVLALSLSVLAFVLYSKSVSVRVDFAFLTRVLHLPSEWAATWLNLFERTLNAGLAYGSPLVAAFFLQQRSVSLWPACSWCRDSSRRATTIRFAGCGASSAPSRSRATAATTGIPSFATAPPCMVGRASIPSGEASRSRTTTARAPSASSSQSWIVARARAGWPSSAWERGPWPPMRGPAMP